MNIIFVGKQHGKSRVLSLSGSRIVLAAACVFVLLAVAVALAFQLGQAQNRIDPTANIVSPEAVQAWRKELASQKLQLQSLEQLTRERLDALTLRMGNMHARLLRLDALGQRLTEVAKLKNGEFDFSSIPAVGGPIEDSEGQSFTEIELNDSLNRIENALVSREQQLEIIEKLFANRTIQKELFIAGRPIGWGWMSSPYGYRSDPFTGKRAWHAGVDFAGKEGSDIVAVASGVVTWSGERYGYGNLVEINHGGGYATRYAHCKELLVDVGTIVEKGEVIAKMGSTGRSTGPHVHYEVLKNGRTLDPKKFIHRASR
ncbi:MAG: hypothetical protein C9356_08260 [Oleiphilus sp.]|nr:MAG: hypothetical protein C9356_08260 [Oleiphilus sp.]